VERKNRVVTAFMIVQLVLVLQELKEKLLHFKLFWCIL